MTFFHLSFRTVGSAAFFLVLAAFASRVLGLARDRILAGTFGAGDELDIYFAAFRIPDLVFNLIIAGSISAAFVPVFISIYMKDKEEAWSVANNFLNIALVTLVILAGVFALLTPYLMPYITPGFSEGKMAETITITRIMFVSTIFLGLSAIFSGILHSFKRFLAYAVAPLFYNGGIIFGALALVPLMGVQGLAWGVVIGAFFHFLIQVPSVLFSGYKLTMRFDIFDSSFRKMFFLIIPRAIGMSLHQFNLWVITAIASTLAAGSVAVFHLANHLQYLPIGIIGISFATAAFPSLSESAFNHKNGDFARNLSSAIRLILFFVLPISVLMFVLRAHIVRIFLGTGEFGWVDTRLTAAALGLFCFGIFAQSLIPILSRAFYAFQNTKTPVYINGIGVLLNVFLSAIFVFWLFRVSSFSNFMGNFLNLSDINNISLLGLPLAFSISGIVNFALLFYSLKKYVVGFERRPFYIAGIKILGASVIAGFSSYATLFIVEPFLDTEKVFGILLQAGASVVSGGIVYLICMILFRSPELSSFLRILRKKIHLTPYSHEYHINGR